MASIVKRAGRNGRVPWGVRVRISGYATLSRSFATKLEAQRWASITEAAARGRTLAVCRDASLADLIDEYLSKAKPSTVFRYCRALSSAFRFGTREPHCAEVTPEAEFRKPARS